MDIIKKNILSFICAIVALIALIASFWPLGGQYEDLQKNLDARAAVFKQAQSLQTKPRQLPTVSDKPASQTGEDDKQALTVFPTPEVIAKGEAAIEQVHTESLEMIQTAVDLNKREQLVPDALPELSDVETFEFKRLYQEALRNVIPRNILRAAAPPTEEEIKKEADAIWEKEYKDTVTQGAGKQGNQQQVQQQFNEAVAKLPEQIRERTAKESLMYIDIGALDISKFITDNQRPDTNQIWYAQVGLWTQADIAASIAAANAGAKSILDAPVKRLLKLDIIETQAGGCYILDKSMGARAGASGGRGAMMGGFGGGYDEPAAAPAGTIPKDFTISPSGRVTSASNTLYDVVHFKLDLIVDARMVPKVLETLGRQKLITILRVDEISSVDAAIDQAEGYIYGDKPVVKISLLGEALFLRAWTQELMPTKVKQELGVQPPPADAAGGVAGAMR
jgi:hypothetical protein